MFLEGFKTQTTHVVVSRSTVARLITCFEFWHRFFFIDTFITGFVLYVVVDGLFGQYVAFISQSAVVVTGACVLCHKLDSWMSVLSTVAASKCFKTRSSVLQTGLTFKLRISSVISLSRS